MSELYIRGAWREGRGQVFASVDPASGETLWEGRAADGADAAQAVEAARDAFPPWADQPLEARVEVVRRFKRELEARAQGLAHDIARETGKPLWESRAEVAAMVGKIEISIAAQAERAGERASAVAFGRAVLRHRPHGVMAVLGPYNFPGHLPNGHIVPALLAGDTVVFKPSEETPHVGRGVARAWDAAGAPPGVFNLLQGGREAGAALIAQAIDGLLFTGSAEAGAQFRRIFVDRPEVILALELGGNNPLIVWDAEPQAAASLVVQSAFITTGQRCSCARRLIVRDGEDGRAVIEAVAALARRLRVGRWNDAAEPFMGPLISTRAAAAAAARFGALEGLGVATLLAPERDGAFVTPGMLDVTGVARPDEEIFAPLLQITRVADFDSAIAAANATRYGLAAGLVADDEGLWRRFLARSRAGVVNWNRPTTGAASSLPFGGLGASGNHRPSAAYAADYCAYPVASFEAATARDTRDEITGLMD